MTWPLNSMARSLCVAIGLTLVAQVAAAQSDRVVALVVSVGEGSARADAVQAELQAMGAETLRSVDPNNAEVRSMLRRFADESEDARATFVYLDMPAVVFAGREYVLPDSDGLLYYSDGLDRPTDLFTKSIPLLAFARTAALAEQGGAVVLTVSAPGSGFPDGLAALSAAPDAVPGAGAILVVDAANADPILVTIAAAAQDEAVEVGAMLRRMEVQEGVSLSGLPQFPIFLKTAPVSEPGPVAATPPIPEFRPAVSEPPAPAAASEVPQPETTLEPEPQESLEELAILEQSLSRSAKRAIQRELRDLDHYKGLVDGIFGPQTRDAITAFQAERAEQPTGLLTRRQLLDLRTSG